MSECLKDCALCPSHTPVKVPMWIGVKYREQTRRVLLVGEAPGKAEYYTEIPFVGVSGQMLEEALDIHCIYRDTLAITNCLKCPSAERIAKAYKTTWRNIPPSKEMLNNCNKWLAKDIIDADPHVIIALGKTAEKVLMSFLGRTIVYVYHPAYIIRHGGVNGKLFADWAARIRDAVHG